MKTSTPSAPKKAEAKSILLIGPPGGGKTTLMLQFPKLKVYDCDRNLDGPERYIRQKVNKSLSYGYDQVCYKPDGSARPVEECFDYLLDQLLIDRAQPDPEVETIGIDSLTLINEFIIRKVLKDNKAPMMQLNYWQPFKTLMNTLICRLRDMGKTTIITCHEVKVEEPDPKNIMIPRITAYAPSINSGIGDYFGAFFTDMWRCQADMAPAGVEYKLVPIRTKLSDLKNSIGLPNEIKNPTYAALQPYLNGNSKP